MSVVAAIELDELVAASETARQPNARHRRFGPAVHHSHFFDRRHPAADQFRHLDFERIWDSKAQATLGSFAHSVDNYLGSMSQNRRAPTADIVDIFVPIDIPNFSATRTFDEKRFSSNVSKCAHGRVYAARNAFLRCGEKLD